MRKYFYCYSYNLTYFIKSQGINYIYKSRNKNNGLQFYAFEKSDHLDEVIDLWNKLKSFNGDF